MINHSDAYSKAITDSSRRMFARAVFDLIDPDAVIGAVTANSKGALDKSEQITDRGVDETVQKAVTLENNRWKLDGTWNILEPTQLVGQHGWQSAKLSGADGAFIEPYPSVEQNISGLEILQAISLQFSDKEYNGFPVDFLIEVLSGTSVIASKEYTNNDKTRIVYDGFTANQPDKLRLTIKRWSQPYKYVRVVRFLAGLYEAWDDNTIKNIDILLESTFSGLSLPYSTCTIEVYNENKRFDPYAPNSIFKSVEERQAIPIEIGLRLPDGTIEWLPGGTFYQQSGGWSLMPLTVQWNLTDVIGMLTSRRFVVPDTLPTTLNGWISAVMASLGKNFKTHYIVDSNVENIQINASKEKLTGMSCGDVIRFACMATNTRPYQDRTSGKLRISKIERIEGNALTLDNMPSYAVMSENAEVSDITFALDNGEVTFPGTNTESDQSLSVDNPFIHTQDDAQKAMISCLLEYGGRKFTAQSRGNPSSDTGDIMSIETQFNTEISARLKRQQIKLEQGVMRNVTSELIQSPNDRTYENSIILAGSGEWTSPVAGTIKVTVIQGGTGGTGGAGGVMTGSWTEEIETIGGTPGSGGKVTVSEVTAVLGQKFPYSCGEGGIGGDGGEVSKDGESGKEGGVTTFGQITSSTGKIYQNGIMDIQSGGVFASPGGSAYNSYGSGGAGGERGSDGYQQDEYNDKGDLVTVVYAKPTAGLKGEDGMNGCIIVEW